MSCTVTDPISLFLVNILTIEAKLYLIIHGDLFNLSLFPMYTTKRGTTRIYFFYNFWKNMFYLLLLFETYKSLCFILIVDILVHTQSNSFTIDWFQQVIIRGKRSTRNKIANIKKKYQNLLLRRSWR